MKNNNNSSFLSHLRNPNDHDQCKKPKLFKCEFCHKVFPTGQALGGHMTSHRSIKQQIHDDHHHVNKGYKTMKITFSLSSSPCDAKQKRHSWSRVFKASVHHPPPVSTMKPIEQPAVDLLNFLPPRSYTTKKRSRRYLVANDYTVAIALLDMSRDSVVDLDLNHRECKRMKLSSSGNDTKRIQKQHVLPTSDRIDETLVKETESIHELGPKVHPPTVSTLEPSQQEIPAIDLLSFLPPRSYNTKKRSKRYLIQHGLANNNTAPIPLDMLPEPVVNLDVNHRECNKMKLSSNGNDIDMMQKPFVPLTSEGIDETVVKEEENLNEGETAVSRVVGNFDLNELPTNDVETGPIVVRDFDLNELPTNDVADEIIHHE